MLTRGDTFNVIAMVLAVLSMALSVTSAAYALSGYRQASLNTSGINAQVKAQRILLGGAPTRALSGVGTGEDVVQKALVALHDYKLPEDN